MPRRGEVWWVRLDPTLGSEIRKRRPCLILSGNVVNERRRAVVIIPLSSSPQAAPPLFGFDPVRGAVGGGGSGPNSCNF
ncbi:MAG: type II toxin-antitoxin system PemK/MazF family toxin [Bryobacteraceae bacterium]